MCPRVSNSRSSRSITSSSKGSEPGGPSGALLTLLFSATLALSAALLMVVQPMFAKMVLPRLGGTPAVWNTCVVFFQIALLSGYAYAHASVRWLGLRRQMLLHLLLLLTPLLVLPMTMAAGDQPDPAGSPTVWLLTRLLLVAGLPFVAVSTSAPVLQRWLAETTHRHAHDPFFLYAASNAGSLAGLVAYPLVIEPWLPLRTQSTIWSAGYAGLVVAAGLCAWWTFRRLASDQRSGSADGARRLAVGERLGRERLSWRMRALWIVLAAVPSSLMLSVTTYVSTDIGAVPLLWVVPLALYLSSFIVAFSRPSSGGWRWLDLALPLVMVLPVSVLLVYVTPSLGSIPIHLACFFVAALFCHHRLASLRPASASLTEFYMWLAVGGVLGGLFNTFVAPHVFTSIAEYPIGLVAVCCLRTPAGGRRVSGVGASPAWIERLRRAAWTIGAPAIVVGLAWALLALARTSPDVNAPWTLFGRIWAWPLALSLVVWRRRVAFALALGGLLVIHQSAVSRAASVLHAERTFYGRLVVSDRGMFRRLTNGTTGHGSQAHDPALRCEPTTYYTHTGPIGELLDGFVGLQRRDRIGVIGLGTGTMATYGTQGRTITFFEISPEVRRIAESGEYFTYLRSCGARYRIEMGDARVTLTRQPDESFDVLLVDAFSSDAIPVHLLTREAVALYFRKLSPNGVLLVHISNRYLDLAPVLRGIADDLSLWVRHRWDHASDVDTARFDKTPSSWVVLTRGDNVVPGLAADSRWSVVERPASASVWTDDFSNLLSVIRWR